MKNHILRNQGWTTPYWPEISLVNQGLTAVWDDVLHNLFLTVDLPGNHCLGMFIAYTGQQSKEIGDTFQGRAV